MHFLLSNGTIRYYESQLFKELLEFIARKFFSFFLQIKIQKVEGEAHKVR